MPKPTESEGRTPEERALVAECARVLKGGGVVGLPTESSCGAAALGDRKTAEARLRGVAGAGARLDLTWASPSAREAEPWASPWLPPGRRLAARYWPGPLVLVLPSSPERRGAAGGDWVALRVPAPRLARAVLAEASGPVLFAPLTGRDGAGARAWTEVPEAVRAGLGAVVPAAEASAGAEPAVVRVGPGKLDVEREGILTAENLRRTAGRRILFVCTGNTCRSPMAEAVARELVVTALGGPSHLSRPRQIELLTAFGYRLESAGIGPPHGSPPSPHAVVAAAEAGLSLEGHAARGVDRELLEEFETVFAMGGRHKHWLDELNAANVKIEMLSPGRDVEDPFGGTLHDYRATLARLRADVEARLPEIL